MSYRVPLPSVFAARLLPDGRWLVTAADQSPFTPATRAYLVIRLRAADREHKRRQRRLEDCGRKRLHIETHYFRAVEALLESTRLTEAEALDQANVKTALGDVLDEWVAQWLNK